MEEQHGSRPVNWRYAQLNRTQGYSQQKRQMSHEQQMSLWFRSFWAFSLPCRQRAMPLGGQARLSERLLVEVGCLEVLVSA
jgi:hypothetical protein